MGYLHTGGDLIMTNADLLANILKCQAMVENINGALIEAFNSHKKQCEYWERPKGSNGHDCTHTRGLGYCCLGACPLVSAAEYRKIRNTNTKRFAL